MSDQTTPIIDWNSSFETTGSLAALYLWIMFNSTYALLNCDLQRALNDNVIVKHVTGIIAFFFLFNIIDPNNKSHVMTTVVKTLVVYVLFLMATKSKWPFIVLVLTLLFADQVLRNHMTYLRNSRPDVNLEKYEKARTYLQWTILTVILIGFIHYMIRQRLDYDDKFSYLTFLLGTKKCNGLITNK